MRGDITEVDVDVVVNAANPGLLGGGGVDGAIHRAAGPAVLAECREIVARLPGHRLPRGQAVATTAGRLPARWIVHTAGPIWSASTDHSAVLRSCYAREPAGGRRARRPHASRSRRSRPACTAGRSRTPPGRRSPACGSAAVEHVAEVRFVLFSDEALAAFEAALSG